MVNAARVAGYSRRPRVFVSVASAEEPTGTRYEEKERKRERDRETCLESEWESGSLAVCIHPRKNKNISMYSLALLIVDRLSSLGQISLVLIASENPYAACDARTINEGVPRATGALKKRAEFVCVWLIVWKELISKWNIAISMLMRAVFIYRSRWINKHHLKLFFW